MAWLIFALGAALCAGGLGTVWSGISYMPVEWGWSQIIAGTTAFSAGVVTIALAALLLRLGAIHKTLRAAGTMRHAVAEIEPEPLAAPRPVPIVISPDISPEAEPERFADSPAEPAEPSPFVHRDIAEAAYDVPSGRDTAANRIDDPIVEPPAPVDIVPEPVAELRSDPSIERPARSRRTGWISPFGARRSKSEPPPVAPSLVDLGPPPWALDPPEPDRPEPSPADPAVLSRLDLEHDSAPPSDAPQPDREEPSADPAILLPAPSAPDAPADMPPTAPAPNGVSGHDAAEPPTVVGRYEAGGASYALFSDGTIEVETETGLHRFASMDDLKQFLERQDQTSRPGWPG